MGSGEEKRNAEGAEVSQRRKEEDGERRRLREEWRWGRSGSPHPGPLPSEWEREEEKAALLVVELLELVFERGGELGVEAFGEFVEGLVGLSLVHEVDALPGGIL